MAPAVSGRALSHPKIKLIDHESTGFLGRTIFTYLPPAHSWSCSCQLTKNCFLKAMKADMQNPPSNLRTAMGRCKYLLFNCLASWQSLLKQVLLHTHMNTQFPFLLLSPELSVFKSPLLKLKYSQEQLCFGS